MIIHGFTVPPGETIRECIELQNIPISEFSKKLAMTEKDTVDLLNGNKHLTIEIASKLEEIFKAPASFWINLEQIYRDELDKGYTVIRSDNMLDRCPKCDQEMHIDTVTFDISETLKKVQQKCRRCGYLVKEDIEHK